MPDYDDYRWLIGAEAQRVMSVLASSTGDLLRAAASLRRDHSASRVHLLLEQVELRRRGRAKFADAERMFFTRVGLEQSTDDWTAGYKAGRLRQESAELVSDLCSGIGGDLVAIARGGDSMGVERDRMTALFGQANCRLASQTARVVVADALRLPTTPDVWHIDPDRRSTGRRTTRVENFEPGLDVIESLRGKSSAGAVKLAPASVVPEAWAQEAELEWISRGGECKQLIAWFGSLNLKPGYRRATLVLTAGPESQVRTLLGMPDEAPPVPRDFGRYLAEPDAAVLASGLTGALAAEHELAAVAPGAVYLTGDRPSPDPAIDWFEITDVLPFDMKQLRSLVRERQIGRLEIKKRGVDVVPEQVAQQLREQGEESATLFLVRRGKRVSAVLTRRLNGGRPDAEDGLPSPSSSPSTA